MSLPAISFSKHKILDSGVSILLHVVCSSNGLLAALVSARYLVLQSSFGRTFLFYILHLATAFNPRCGWCGMGMVFFILSPRHPAGFALCRSSDGGLWVPLGNGKGNGNDRGHGSETSPPLLCVAGFHFDDDTFGKRPRAKSGPRLFWLLLCCCVCNTKIPQTIDLSSLPELSAYIAGNSGISPFIGLEIKKK
jgi:hypothetical protein